MAGGACATEGLFHPMLQQDWALQALKKLKQTDNMSTVTFITKFMKLKYYAKTDDSAAVGLLEDNVHPHIHFQLFLTGWCSTDYDATLISIKEIGTNLKAYCMFAYAGQEASPSKMIRQMEYLGHHEELCAEVMNLGKNLLILGYMWLKKHNPVIDWQMGTMKFSHCPHSCHMLQNQVKHLAILDKEAGCEGLEFIHQAKVEAPVAKKPVCTPKELMPPCYYSYLNIFSEKAASWFSLQKPWDHAIDLKDMFKPKKG